MKVALLLQDTRTIYGAEQATLRLAEGLKAAGIQVMALLLRETRLGAGNSPLAEALRARIPVREIEVAGRFSASALDIIREIMARDQVDLLHSTGYKADCHAALASRKGRLFPVISTVHGWLFRHQLRERLYQVLNVRALRHFNRVIVLCRFYENYLRRCGLHPLQIARIPTGVDPAGLIPRDRALALWRQPDAVFCFGMFGRLSEEKEHRLLIRAAARLARKLEHSPRSWRILIAGDGPLRKDLQRRVKRAGLADRVTWGGYMTPEEFFGQVHVLIQCSRVENQPVSVLQAMEWMRPVLATKAGGLPELVEDGVTGRVTPKGAVRPLSRAMQQCLVSPETASGQGMAGRDRLERDFPESLMIQDTIGVYETALAGKNPA